MSDRIDLVRQFNEWTPTIEDSGNYPALRRAFLALRSENERLQEAKRRALAIADERSKENVALRAAAHAFDACLSTDCDCPERDALRQIIGTSEQKEPT